MDDLISRQDAIKTLCERRCGDKPKGCPSGFCTESLAVDCIPSAQPERKMGKWIEYNATGKNQWMCSECCAEEKNPKVARFCYWCGAEMERSDNG